MFEQAFKAIDDVLRKEAGCTTELDYTEQTSWLLFLKYTRHQVFLNFVLRHYVNVGVEELDLEKLTPLIHLKYDTMYEAISELGKPDEIRNVFSGFQKYICERRGEEGGRNEEGVA